MKKLASVSDPLWYKDAIIYELHVRAFADSNGDGIGDFQGLVSKLDYLQDLGITCIWLLPFFPSPLRDDGYDIANYVDVNPSYGTLSDFKTFLAAAHERNIQVMIELVVNHTSDQHPWFQAARLAPPGSPQREMYVWSQTDQLYRDARIIFTDTEKSNWTWDETAKAYYWHRFFSHQPDLNFENPLVIEEVLKAMRFWLDMGVDGLRMDAIPYLCERDGTSCENLPETHSVIRTIRQAIDAEYENRLILAEANQWPADVRPYFGEGDECHMAFHFPLMPRIYMALRQEDRLPITDIMAQTPPIPDSCQWGLFLRNHDELTLEMVTEDERDYMYFAYSADPRMRINVGIRRRLAPLVDNNRRRIELLNSILFSFPGTPIIYYGDEIGMGDNIYLGDRNGVRTPMQWTSDRNAGFSRCDPARLYFPVIMDPIYGYQVVNVEAQLSDQSSLLHWTRNMIALRKLFQVFGRGTLTFFNPANRKVLAYLRDLKHADGSHETVLCVANLSRFAQPVSLDLSAFEGMQPVEMLGYVSFPRITAAPYSLALAPYSFLWLELQTAAPETSSSPESWISGTEPAEEEHASADELIAVGWSRWLAESGTVLLEAAIPAWIVNQRWFAAKTRTVQSVRLLDFAEMPAAPGVNQPSAAAPILLFAEIRYDSGPGDVYQIPIACCIGSVVEALAANHPQAILASLTSLRGRAVLCDAASQESLHGALLELIQQNQTVSLRQVVEDAQNSTTQSLWRGLDATPSAGSDIASSSFVTEHQPDPGAHDSAELGASQPHPLSLGSTATPAPIDAQPGETATPPRSTTPTVSSATQRTQPRESPSAGASAPSEGHLDGRSSRALAHPFIFTPGLSRIGSAEQSNTSILYGKTAILKLFRRLQPGENPDVEVSRFLAEVAHFSHIAPFAGDLSITPTSGEKTTIALLQGLVANQGDGWSWFLSQLDGYFPSVLDRGDAPELAPPGFENENPHAELARHLAAAAMQAAALLGRRTAEMHLALSTPTDDPAFKAMPVSREDLEDDARRLEAQMAGAFDVLKPKLVTLDETTADAAIQVLARRLSLFAILHEFKTLRPAGERIRIHGDYHLGQTLRVAASSESCREGDFVILDFEGEPARPLAERRTKASPLKDVAGMLRSFSYASQSGLEHYRSENPEISQNVLGSLSRWANFWERSAASAFLISYRETIVSRPNLLPDGPELQSLLRGYLLEKALYELLYEMNNRPAWARIPLAGILALSM